MEAGRGKEEEKYLRRVQERETIINSERERGREGERGECHKERCEIHESSREHAYETKNVSKE